MAALVLAGCGGGSTEPEGLTHINRSETYAEQGQYRSAMLEIKNAIQQEPENLDYILRLSDLYLRVGAYPEVETLLGPRLDQQPGEIALPLAESYIGQGKHLSARETLALADLETPEEKGRGAVVQGGALRLAGDYQAAIEQFEKALAEGWQVEKATAGILKTYLHLNNPQKAVSEADSYLAEYPESSEVLMLKGRALYTLNRLEPAVEALTAAVGALPNSDFFLPVRRQTLTLLSRVLTEQGRVTEAQVYNRVLAENTDSDLENQAKSAISAIKEGRFDEASETLQDLLQLNPDNERIALTLGALNLQQGRLQEGLDLLSQNIDPETSPTRFIRLTTMARIDKGERREAYATLARAIEARPDDTELLAMHGMVALSLEDTKSEGVASLSRALSLNPENVRLRLALANYYEGQGMPEQALGQLRIAFANKPDDWPTTAAYVRLLIREGQTGELRELQQSLENGYPENRSAQLLAAISLAGTGDTEEAIKKLEGLRDTNPESIEVNITLAQLYQEAGQPAKAVNSFVAAAKQTEPKLPLLFRAARLHAANHQNESAVEDWTKSVSQAEPELADALAATEILWLISEDELETARSRLAEVGKGIESASLKTAEANLLAAEAQKLTLSEQWDDAVNKAQQAFALNPENQGFALLPARIRTQQGNIEAAESAVLEVEQVFGATAPVTTARAAILQADNRAEEAFQTLYKFWSESGDPAVLPALVQLSNQVAQEKTDELTAKWVDLVPDSVPANLSRGNQLMTEGNIMAAANHYQKVLQRDPLHTTALNNLAWALRDTDTPRALEFAARAAEIEPENPAILDTYGWILHLDGQHRAAMDQLQRALAMAPDNEEFKKHLDEIRRAL
ncbi:tetratricopeptide repeat protein [Marinobacter adhaerens]|uniref:tetratricopeptide repeat protein n=1 Tax=Marinobacter adhaerens TaxID=1033846 RepID=UPI001C5DA001|nr:tetratricopeptide repeat protein [Marinobacter adhaerens]MBW4978400.1 tetratricopeptide repeat protein [Marinobacter adhaerens]